MNLSNDEINEYYKQLMNTFEPAKDFKVKDYYGVAMMSVKKNDNVQIRLQYDYGSKHPVNGKPIEVDDIEQAMIIYHVLMTKRIARTNHTKFKLSMKKVNVEPEVEGDF